MATYANETEVLEAIRDVLDGTAWNSDTSAQIAQIMEDFGYPIADLDDKPATKVEGRVFLDVTADGLKVFVNGAYVGIAKNTAELSAIFIESTGDIPETVTCSSSLDFPHEYTSDPEVLALVALIRE